MVILLICLDNIILCLINQGFIVYYYTLKGRFYLKWIRCCLLLRILKILFVQLHPDIPIEKVGFVYNGILSKEMHICPEKHLGPLEICCVGSVSKRKGQDMIVESSCEDVSCSKRESAFYHCR